MVVGSEREGYFVVGDFVVGVDGGLAVAVELVDERLVEACFTRGKVEDETAGGIDVGMRAGEGNGDLLGVGVGCEDKIVFELALVPVEDQVDARVDAGVLHALVGCHRGMPIGGVVADEVVGSAREDFHPAGGGGDVRALKLHAQGGGCGFGLSFAEFKHGFAGGEEESISLSAREELHALVNLTAIGFEAEWNFSKVCLELRFRRELGCGLRGDLGEGGSGC